MKAGWISLSFDDALDEHLDHVIPILNANQILGTFYAHLCSPCFLRRQSEWRRAAVQGHEIGNHTVFHPADARKGWVRPGSAIDYYTIDRMKLELEFANQFLATMDGRTQRTFAYPCSNTILGSRGWVRRFVNSIGLEKTRVIGWIDRTRVDFGSTQESYEPIVADLFAAGRGGGLVCGQATPAVSTWRRTQLPSAPVEEWSLTELQHHVSAAVEANTWSILQFHGVGGGHRMNCDLGVFKDFVMWLRQEHFNRLVTVLAGTQRLWPDATIA